MVVFCTHILVVVARKYLKILQHTTPWQSNNFVCYSSHQISSITTRLKQLDTNYQFVKV